VSYYGIYGKQCVSAVYASLGLLRLVWANLRVMGQIIHQNASTEREPAIGGEISGFFQCKIFLWESVAGLLWLCMWFGSCIWF
jgi:hypothetical protein